MTNERWQEVKEIFCSALELSPQRRGAFIAEACLGQNSLRREVESLIAAHDESDHFIDEPAFQASAEMLEDDQELKAGDMVGRYEIHSLLGAGGMGKVYLANDTKLNRKIALKVLSTASRYDEAARTRLLREAQAAAALNHPNICAIYEVDDEGDRSYIAMQFVDGETLEVRMAREMLSLQEALNVTSQIADALCEAHAHSVIHRDVKPSNIMLDSRGQVKVLDFGLAKGPSAISVIPDTDESKPTLTTPGTILGTVPYMSPEQLRGETAGPHSDVFSLGVVMYEMFSGQPAFARGSDAEIIGAILHEQPPALSSVNPNITDSIEAVVTNCLSKEVAQRYQTVQQLADDLRAARNGALVTSKGPKFRTTIKTGIAMHPKRRLLAITAAIVLVAAFFSNYAYFTKGGEPIDSIAVLPFVNVNNDPNTEYLSDGLSDSIINSLSQLPNLKKVSAFSSVLRYKGKQTDPQTVGRELNVRAVLMGRLIQRGDDLSISAELVDVTDNKRLWHRQYDRKLADALKLRGDIAQEISEGLRLKLTSMEKQQLAKSATTNPEVYELYLRGRFYQRDRAGDQKARDYLEQAIEKDPNYGPAYAQLAYTYVGAVLSDDWSTRKEAQKKMKWAAQKALELDDTLGDAHAALSFTAEDWSVRLREFQRALELDPNSADIHAFYARVLWEHRRIDEALLHIKRAVELDPLSQALRVDLGKILYSAGQRDQAVEQYRKALELNPNYGNAYKLLASYYLAEGRYEEAIAAAEKMRANVSDGRAFLGYIYAVAGKRAEAEKILHELQEEAKQRHVGSEKFALIYTGLGDKDRAFEFLQKEVEEAKILPIFIRVLPEWASLRTDPRFEVLLQHSEWHRE